MPTGRAQLAMVWHDLAFLHWRVPAERLRPLVPAGLALDTFDGSAWLGVVPFRMSGVRPYGVPLPGGFGAFPELNVRTYVTAEDKPGVWFFSLDAASKLAVRTARLWFHLPYFDARMRCDKRGDAIDYASERTHRGASPWRFEGHYRPTSEPEAAQPGSLEAFLVERYCLYACDSRERLYRGEIHHIPWPLQQGEVEVRRCELAQFEGVTDFDEKPLVHFAERLDVRAWAIQRF